MKQTLRIIALTLVLVTGMCMVTGCDSTGEVQGADSPIRGVALPLVHSYEVEKGEFSVSAATVLTNQSSFTDWEATFGDFNENLVAYGVLNAPLSIGENGAIILASDESVDEQAYRIEIGEDKAIISAADNDGAFYGMRTLLKLLVSSDNRLTCGTIADKPDVPVRAMHLAMANALYSKEFIFSLLHELAWNNMNELQLHFGEIHGLRFALNDMSVTYVDENGEMRTVDSGVCLTEPYFTEEDMKEIIALAQSLHIRIVPALDTPGHMDQLISPMIESGQFSKDYAVTIRYDNLKDENGNPLSYNGLNLNNEGAVNYALGVFDNYVRFFSEQQGVETFHIGGDEYLIFQPDNTVSEETFYGYMNKVAAVVKSYGLEVRAWDDAVSPTLSDKDIVVTNWYGKYADLPGFKQINCNFYRLYYSMSESFRTKDDEKSVYELWTPSLFAGDTAPEGEYVHGAMYCIWGAPRDEQEVAAKMRPRLKATAMKSWNSTSLTVCKDKTGLFTKTVTLTMSYDSYLRVLEKLGLANKGFSEDGVPCGK